MKVGDCAFFAPDIPFSAVDITGAFLPDQLLARLEGYYLTAADCCVQAQFAFGAGVLVVCAADAMSRLAHGPNRKRRSVGDDFKGFARMRLPSFATADSAALLYDCYRNGLVHEARLKNGCSFVLGEDKTLNTDGAYPVVDAEKLLAEVRSAIHALVAEMRDSDAFRHEVAVLIQREFAIELALR